MTPVEKLQAAIEKLDRLKVKITPGPWSVNVHHNAAHSAEFRARGPFNGFMLVATHTNDADCELIVTLHRTIDAQLAILRNTVRLYGEFVALGKEDVWLDAIERAGDLALADAILGGDS